MAIRIKIVEVNIENVKNGKNAYSKAEIIHTANGQQRTQKVMSFSNPAVFKTIQHMKPGEEYDITVTKNDQGYNQWAAVERAKDADGDFVPTPASVRNVPQPAVRSTYETPEERAQRQLMIVRQSSISNALTYLQATQKEGEYGVTDVINVAQDFVDFVYGNNVETSLADMENDIPE
jgi:hypothetical protein